MNVTRKKNEYLQFKIYTTGQFLMKTHHKVFCHFPIFGSFTNWPNKLKQKSTYRAKLFSIVSLLSYQRFRLVIKWLFSLSSSPPPPTSPPPPHLFLMHDEVTLFKSEVFFFAPRKYFLPEFFFLIAPLSFISLQVLVRNNVINIAWNNNKLKQIYVINTLK